MWRSALPVILVILSLALPPVQAGEPAAAIPAEESARPPGRSGLPVPRFVSLRAGEVNVRAGPGFRYPIEWVYRRAGQPVEIIDEYETWRRIRDWEGTLGWVHQSMLQGRRNVRLEGEEQLLRGEAARNGTPLARVEPGAIGALRRCRSDWCEVDFSGHVGWLPRDSVYGIYPDETLD